KGDRVLLCDKEEVERDLDLIVDQQGPDEGPATARLEPRRGMPILHRLRGRQGPCRKTKEDRQGHRERPWWDLGRQGPWRAVRPEEVRHPVHPRLPAGPRSDWRCLRDSGAVVEAPAVVQK